MPAPLKPGYNFHYDRQLREFHYEMSCADSYTDFYGISFMISGERLVFSPELTTVINTGNLTFIQKNFCYRTTYLTDTPYERIVIKFTDKMVANLISKIGQHTFDKLFAEMVLHFEEASQKKLLCIFDEMEQEWAHYNSYSELLLEGLLNKLIITAMQERLPCSKHEFVLSGQHQALIDAVRYVDRHFMENPSLEDTARAVNVSASYLSKLFTQNITSTYSQFLTREKINHASKLLSHTNLSITEISGQSGFQNSNYFSDAFKKVTGKSPLKFRKQLHSE